MMAQSRDTAARNIENLHALLNKTKDPLTKQKVSLELAREISNGYESLIYSTQSLQLATSLQNKDEMANSYIELGNDYLAMSDYENAIKAVYGALKLYEESDNNVKCGSAINLLGNINYYRNRYAEAIPYYKRALNIHLRLNDSMEIVNDYVNVGDNYRRLGRLDSALFFLFEAERLSRKINYIIGIAYSLENLGLVHFVLGHEKFALKKLERARCMFDSLRIASPISEFKIELAQFYFKRGQDSLALKFAKEGYDVASKARLKTQLRDASEIISQLFERKKEHEMALDYLKKYYSYKDNLSNEKSLQKINALQMGFEISTRDEQLHKVSATSKRNFIGVIALSVVVLLVALLSFYLFRLNKKLKRAYNKLQDQSLQLNHQKRMIEDNLKDKETLLKEIHHRVKNNLQIISSLLNLQSNTLEDEQLIEIFQKGQSRIQSIALIHQKLYQNEDITVINIREYTEQLSLKLIDSLAKNDDEIRVEVRSVDILLDIDTAVPLGLMINELITNSIKYAFHKGEHNYIRMEITELERNYYRLHYSDTGKGLPETFSLQHSASLGSKLLSILTRQLGGQISYYNEKGANFIITFYDLVKVKESVLHGKN